MNIKISRIAVVTPGGTEAGLVCGVAQVRELDARGRIARDGAVALLAQTSDGEKVTILLSPEEAMQIGPLVIASAVFAANEPPPMIGAPPSPPPRLVTQ